jgi:hypothetical protein
LEPLIIANCRTPDDCLGLIGGEAIGEVGLFGEPGGDHVELISTSERDFLGGTGKGFDFKCAGLGIGSGLDLISRRGEPAGLEFADLTPLERGMDKLIDRPLFLNDLLVRSRISDTRCLRNSSTVLTQSPDCLHASHHWSK